MEDAELLELVQKARGYYEHNGVKFIGTKKHVYNTNIGPVAVFKGADKNIFYVALKTLEMLDVSDITT